MLSDRKPSFPNWARQANASSLATLVNVSRHLFHERWHVPDVAVAMVADGQGLGDGDTAARTGTIRDLFTHGIPRQVTEITQNPHHASIGHLSRFHRLGGASGFRSE